MSLGLDSLLWVLPGICFLFAYHRLRDVEALDFSGWSYVFFIVFVGAITILPIQWLFDEKYSTSPSASVLLVSVITGFILPFIIKYIFIPFVNKMDTEPNFFMPSSFWSIVYFFFPLENRDKFIKNCIDYEGLAVLITVDEPILLKNTNTHSNIESTVYFGFLIEFPYVATQSIDSQVIRILPLLTGYRYIKDNKKSNEEKLQWIKKYTPNEDSQGIIIPRSKIIHFCLYDTEQHEDIVFNSCSGG